MCQWVAINVVYSYIHHNLRGNKIQRDGTLALGVNQHEIISWNQWCNSMVPHYNLSHDQLSLILSQDIKSSCR